MYVDLTYAARKCGFRSGLPHSHTGCRISRRQRVAISRETSSPFHSQAHDRGSNEGGPQRPTHNSSPRRRQRRFVFFALRLFFFQRNHEVKQGAGAIPDKRRSSRGGARGLTMAALPKPSFRKRALLVGVALVGGARRRRRRPRRLGFEPTATTVGPRSTPRGSERRRRRRRRCRRRRRRRRRPNSEDRGSMEGRSSSIEDRGSSGGRRSRADTKNDDSGAIAS